MEAELAQRSGGRCELCNGGEGTHLYEVPPQNNRTADDCITVCSKCVLQLEKKEELDSAHWKALTETMWTEVPGVQVVARRMLNRLSGETWAAEHLDMFYLDDEKLAWAKATGDHEGDSSVALHKDAYGVLLQTGDTVVLTKSLDVKGTSFSANLGTVVRNIRLVPENTEQIEGKIEGQVIVILTKYMRRQSS